MQFYKITRSEITSPRKELCLLLAQAKEFREKVYRAKCWTAILAVLMLVAGIIYVNNDPSLQHLHAQTTNPIVIVFIPVFWGGLYAAYMLLFGLRNAEKASSLTKTVNAQDPELVLWWNTGSITTR